jgi:two-component system copper resistance phosphate regulon response regulator CusR
MAGARVARMLMRRATMDASLDQELRSTRQHWPGWRQQRFSMAILLVEDEPKTLLYLHKGLKENGFVVDTAEDGEQGLAHAVSRRYDLIVLDVMLPLRDGWSVLTEIRRTQQTPVLFLTARDSIQDRVRGLELGADDYLIKPFAFSELLARVRSVLRRGPTRPSDALCVADLELDSVAAPCHPRTAAHQPDAQGIRAAELAAAAHRGGPVAPLLAEQVWDMQFDSDTNVVDVAIRRLRSKVDEPFQARLIHTVRGVGYVLEAR